MNTIRRLIPPEISLYACNVGDGLALGIHEGKSCLLASGGEYETLDFSAFPLARIPCELVACKRWELKVGDTGYCTGDVFPDRSNLDSYCKILGPQDIVHYRTDLKKLVVNENDLSRLNWFKVIPLQLIRADGTLD